MSDLGQQLRQYIDEITPPVSAAEVQHTMVPRPRQGKRRERVLVAVALAGAVGVVGAALALRADDRSSVNVIAGDGPKNRQKPADRSRPIVNLETGEFVANVLPEGFELVSSAHLTGVAGEDLYRQRFERLSAIINVVSITGRAVEQRHDAGETVDADIGTVRLASGIEAAITKPGDFEGDPPGGRASQWIGISFEADRSAQVNVTGLGVTIDDLVGVANGLSSTATTVR